MTPQLQQAIKLLQLNRMDLAEALREEIEKNPVLEEQGDDDADGDDGEEAPADAGAAESLSRSRQLR
jgi:RNA polymerase sigma-54 factor